MNALQSHRNEESLCHTPPPRHPDCWVTAFALRISSLFLRHSKLSCRLCVLHVGPEQEASAHHRSMSVAFRKRALVQQHCSIHFQLVTTTEGRRLQRRFALAQNFSGRSTDYIWIWRWPVFWQRQEAMQRISWWDAKSGNVNCSWPLSFLI